MRHELHLLRRGLRGWILVTVPLIALGYLIAGGSGAASVAVGAGIVAGNHVVAALSTGWARTLHGPAMAVGYAVFAMRMLVVFVGLAALTTVPWVHRGLVATAFCVALAVTLGAECFSYVRRSYVPAWRVVSR